MTLQFTRHYLNPSRLLLRFNAYLSTKFTFFFVSSVFNLILFFLLPESLNRVAYVWYSKGICNLLIVIVNIKVTGRIYIFFN